MNTMLRWAAAAALATAASASADVAPPRSSDELPVLPGDEAVAAKQQAHVLRTLPDRPREVHAGKPLDVAVGEVPNVRTAPPSDDKRYNPRTEKEWAWQSPQRGTGATGLWPMPSTGGQPGTLQ